MSNAKIQPTTQTEVYVLGCNFIAELIAVNMSGGTLRTLNLYRSGSNDRKLLLHKSYSTCEEDEQDAKADIGSFLTDVKRCEQIWNRFMDD
ncbi:MAG: hypothetical protein ACI4W6_01855 [Acutalibacteraceae bacterium]